MVRTRQWNTARHRGVSARAPVIGEPKLCENYFGMQEFRRSEQKMGE
jgi:hypothetical protein